MGSRIFCTQQIHCHTSSTKLLPENSLVLQSMHVLNAMIEMLVSAKDLQHPSGPVCVAEQISTVQNGLQRYLNLHGWLFP